MYKLEKDMIQFADSVESWQKAVTMAALPLLQKGYIKESYIDAMINLVEELGPYIVLMPNFAMPHARPENGAIKGGFSILKLNEPVYFSEDRQYYAKVILVLSCENSDSHIKVIQWIGDTFSSSENCEKLFNAGTTKEILDIFNREENQSE